MMVVLSSLPKPQPRESKAYVEESVFDYVQLNPPVVAGVFISRHVGAPSASVLGTEH